MPTLAIANPTHHLNKLDTNEEITIACTWQRGLQDTTVNADGRALCSLMHSMHMVVLNGMHLFPHTHGYTCHTTNDGHSVVDYAMVHVNAMQICK